MSDVVEQLEELVKGVEEHLAKEPPATGTHLEVTNLHEEYKHILTTPARQALEHSIPSTIGVRQMDGGTECPCGNPPPHHTKDVEYTRSVYLSVIARSPEGIAKAAKLIYEEVNKLSEQGLLKGNLCLLSALKLAHPAMLDLSIVKLGPGLPATAIFCFPHVPLEAKVEGPLFCEEGQGPRLDLEPELEPVVLERTTIISLIQQQEAAERIAEMERCCIETPCFVDSCPKCSAGR
jgi:hypothetical protein